MDEVPRRLGGRDHAVRNWVAVVALGMAALLAGAKIGEEVLERDTNAFDAGVRAWALAHQLPPMTSFLHWVTIVGSVNPMICLAVAGALFLWWRGRPLVACTVLIAPAAAVSTYVVVKNIVARTRPAGLGSIVEGTYAFPSAHATSSAAVCCTLAYVFWRERIAPTPVAVVIGIVIPLLIGVSRVYLDVHWATDVLGGWCAGIFIAALSGALYNGTRRSTPAPDVPEPHA
jgi:undecaprenyl-diphosphatase